MPSPTHLPFGSERDQLLQQIQQTVISDAAGVGHDAGRLAGDRHPARRCPRHDPDVRAVRLEILLGEGELAGGPVLRIRDLRVGTADGDIVRGADLEVASGEIVGLVGESGCGKTTLGLAVAGLLGTSRRVLGGSISFEGETIVSDETDRTEPLRGGRIGFVPQDPFGALDPLRHVGPQLARPLRLHQGLSEDAALDKVCELLASVEIGDPRAILRRYPHELSGGQLQRAVIASALSCEPRW